MADSPSDSAVLVAARGPSVTAADADESVRHESGGGEKVVVHDTPMEEVREVLALCWPISLSYLLKMSLGVVNLIFVGHLGAGDKELAAASLGNMYANVTGFSIGIGLATAMDTLCGQAFGARNFKLLGLVAQRGVVILGVACIPIAVLWWYCEEILLLAQQDPEIAKMSAQYVWRFLPGLWPSFIFECQSNFLLNQGITIAPMLAMLLTAIANPIFVYLLVHFLDYGFLGAPLAVSCSYFVLATAGGVACWYYRGHGEEATWRGFSWDIFKDWWTFMSLGLPGMIMLCAEWWSFEVVAIGAGWLGTDQLATQGVMMNTVAVIFMVPLGVSIACSIRVGNLIGASEAKASKLCAWVSVALGVGAEVIENVLILTFRHAYSSVWTHEQQVVHLVENVLLIVVGFNLMDGGQAVLSGILRGLGRQSLGAYANLVSYALVGLPLAFGLAFWADWNIYGLWAGLAFALLAQVLILGCVVFRVNWDREVELARARVGKEDALAAGAKPQYSALEMVATQDPDGQMQIVIGSDSDTNSDDDEAGLLVAES